MIILFLILFIIIISSSILLFKRKKEKKRDKVLVGKEKLGTFISPSEFNGGSLVRKAQYPSANNCDHNILYPINAVDVYYGSKMPSNVKDCPCMQFIQAP